MYLRFNVESQHLTRTDRSIVVARSENYLKAKFDFSPDWDGVTKTGVFTNGGRVYNVILDNDECFVPTEVIRKGCFTVSVFGGDLITADVVTIRVEPSGYEVGGSPEPPTPEVYEQVLGMFDKFRGGEEGQVLSKSSDDDLEFEWVDQGGGGGGTAPRWGNIAGTLANQTDLQAALDAKENAADAFDGNYENLTNKPTLFSGDYRDLTNKPELFSGDYDDLSNKPTLFSGNYNDLTNKPDIPTIEANPTLSGQEPTLRGISINGDGFIVPTGGAASWIDERDITTKRLKVTDDMELTNISSEETLYLYENDNLCALPDVAETTANGITYKVENGLIYLNGTATKTFYIDVAILAPKFLLNQTMNFFIEPVSGERTTANIYVWTPFKYLSGSEEKQLKPSTGNAQFTYSKVIGFTTDTKIQVGSGAVCTNLVLRPYFGLRMSNITPAGTTGLPTGIKHVVGSSLSNANGTIYGIDYAFSAHVKSRTELPKLFGKKMVSCGDSIAYGHGGDPYVYTIANNQNMSYEKEAVGEARLTSASPTRSVLAQVTELTDDYDFILVEGGINDALNGSTIGELTSGFDATLDDTTVIGAVETICKFLVEHYASAKKLFILCHRTTNANYQPHAAQTTYFEAIITALKKWNIPYIDLREFPLCGYNSYYAQTYFNQSDFTQHGGLHPNTAGYALGYINPITAKMESI